MDWHGLGNDQLTVRCGERAEHQRNDGNGCSTRNTCTAACESDKETVHAYLAKNVWFPAAVVRRGVHDVLVVEDSQQQPPWTYISFRPYGQSMLDDNSYNMKL